MPDKPEKKPKEKQTSESLAMNYVHMDYWFIGVAIEW